MTPIIEINDLSYTYPEGQVAAIKNLSLTIEKGAWVALIGHNGSGKSTLARLLNYLLPAQAGTIKIAGLPVDEEHVWQIRDLIGMVFQNPDNQFVGATVADDIAFGLENRAVPRTEMIPRVQAAMEKVRMAPFAEREPAHLSGGQKQRVAIASVLAIQPQILILDEATAMLDPQGRQEMLDLVRELKTQAGEDLTVISITHDIDEAALADQVLVLNDGQLVESGRPADIFADAAKLTQLGLAVPFAEQVKQSLAQAGITVPKGYMTTEGMVNWIWQSISKQ